MANFGKQAKTIERERIIIDLLKQGETLSGTSIEKSLDSVSL